MKDKAIGPALVFACVVGSGLVPSVNAGTLGYWRFEGGTDSNEIVVATSEENSPAMDGEQWNNNGTNVLYGSDVPGAYIYDPLTTQYSTNTGSMLAPATAGADNSQILVHDMSALAGSWTLEMFVKVEDDGGAATWLNNAYNRVFNLDGSSSCNGSVGATGGGTTLLKLLCGGQTINDYSSNFEDGGWHHLAYVSDYDGTNTTVTLYRDYVSVGRTNFIGQTTHASNQDLRFGISSAQNVPNLDWFLDDVRLSDSALSTSQFLRVLDQVPTNTNDLMLTSIQVTNIVALSGGATQSGTVYRLQYTEQQTDATWTSLPLYFEGGDTNLFFVDPTGVFTNRSYRLIQE